MRRACGETQVQIGEYFMLEESPAREQNFAFDEEKLKEYKDNYSEESFWDKIAGNFSVIGCKLMYKALQLYYVFQWPGCPLKVKAAVCGALGYLILPGDLVADFLPVIGYSDDGQAVAAALALAQCYVNDKIKAQAKEKLQILFGDKAAAKL